MNDQDMKTDPKVNPWHPMKEAVDLKHLGKLAEECGECVSATNRCMIQGINETEPVTGKPNKEWLEDEIADVLANIQLVRFHFKLDNDRIVARAARKIELLRQWHVMA